eukprot:1685116-Rhodomonas_salina.2
MPIRRISGDLVGRRGECAWRLVAHILTKECVEKDRSSVREGKRLGKGVEATKGASDIRRRGGADEEERDSREGDGMVCDEKHGLQTPVRSRK